MTLHRGMDGWDPVTRPAGAEEERRRVRSGLLAVGTLACPVCDAPVAPGARALTPADLVGCPYCNHVAVVRDFLSLAEPTRPARVAVRVVRRHAG